MIVSCSSIGIEIHLSSLVICVLPFVYFSRVFDFIPLIKIISLFVLFVYVLLCFYYLFSFIYLFNLFHICKIKRKNKKDDLFCFIHQFCFIGLLCIFWIFCFFMMGDLVCNFVTTISFVWFRCEKLSEIVIFPLYYKGFERIGIDRLLLYLVIIFAIIVWKMCHLTLKNVSLPIVFLLCFPFIFKGFRGLWQSFLHQSRCVIL